ncbi:response regulator transcription factor [Vagococcus sp. BWB3-3]|uniref:Response regulator transcription factor n=1 Tax=Vagococcus allomyrinae TaxID=2794353 RepID=A0A940STB8_9ENTE|nr:LytTR family DNA-binding domain-containing protein [Vagococcus allomyrinae]MBP1040140.1 response regulator transcription factor [Vagococcus allomyrinae]
MVQLIICEDQTIFRQRLVSEIEKYIMMSQYDIEIELATAYPSEVLSFISKKPARRIYFLDIDLQDDDYDGFSLGKVIRQYDPRGFIIYVTTHDELAFETFKHRVEAMDYIVKDEAFYFVKQIKECLDSVVTRLSSELTDDRHYYTVEIFSAVHHVPVDDIILVETVHSTHRVLLHTHTQSLEFFGGIDKIGEELGKGFFRAHRSYLLHLKKVKSVDFKERLVFLQGGIICEVARAKKKELRAALNKLMHQSKELVD